MIRTPTTASTSCPGRPARIAEQPLPQAARIGLILFLVLGIVIPLLPLHGRRTQPSARTAGARGAADGREAQAAAAAATARRRRSRVKRKVEPSRSPAPVEPPAKPRRARRREKSACSAMKDELADLRGQADPKDLAKTKPLTGAVGDEPRAERSLITSKVGQRQRRHQHRQLSRGFGGGAGSLGPRTRRPGRRAEQRLAATAAATSSAPVRAARPRAAAKKSRLVFDRNKGAIYALYSRALREDPRSAGQAGAGVHHRAVGRGHRLRVVSSELKDPELERKIVARVKLFRFPRPRTWRRSPTTKPIEFFPA